MTKLLLSVTFATVLVLGGVHAAEEQKEGSAEILATLLAGQNTVKGVIGADTAVAVYFTEDPSAELATKVCEFAKEQGFERIDKIVANVNWHTPAPLCN